MLNATTTKPLSAQGRRLRAELLNLLREQGLLIADDYLLAQRTYAKEEIREIHALSRNDRLLQERPFVLKWLPRLSKYLASGTDVKPALIDPFPVVVDGDDEMAALFRLATMWWSIPVSRGFGRRFRVVVFDKSNGKLLGLLGMTDPVFNLRARDLWIDWDVREREERLTYVMDAFVLGAVPPYNRLLGAKFVALLAASDFTRAVFRKRYRTSRSIIRKRKSDGRLALVTATSALGPSSIYNRLAFEGVDVFRAVGLTEGFGHFHLANGTYEGLRDYLAVLGENEVERNRFGNGPNYKIRVVRKALERLNLPGDLLRHGIRRTVYVAPLAENSAAFLRGDNERLRCYERPFENVVDFWRKRWMLPRASRDSSYLNFDRESWNTITGI